jgi:hypothetical protein
MQSLDVHLVLANLRQLGVGLLLLLQSPLKDTYDVFLTE